MMSLLKNKVFIIVAVVVAILIIAVPGYKAFSLYSFNSLTKELDQGNKDLFASFKTEVEAANKINENLLKSAEFGLNFSKETNSKYTNQAKTDYDKLLKDYKKGLEELESEVSDLDNFTKMPLLLSSDQKKFANDMNSAFEVYLKTRKEDYQFQIKTQPVFNNEIQILNDAFAFVDYSVKASVASAAAQTPAQIAAAFSANLSDISSLEKYTESDYKFEGQDELASEFPLSYKEFDSAKEVFGATYLLYEAIAKGDLTKIPQLDQMEALFNTWILSAGGSLVELADKSKPYEIKLKDAYISYAKVLDFFAGNDLHSNLLSKEEVLGQNNQNKLIVFAYLVKLYSLDNGKYPTDTDFSSLVTTLKSSNHFDDTLQFNESDFTYTSPIPSYFEIGHKDEVSGQTSKVVVGVKETQTSTLGATAHSMVIKVKDRVIDLEFVSDLINAFESLLPLRP
jgi:hypothetical protein